MRIIKTFVILASLLAISACDKDEPVKDDESIPTFTSVTIGEMKEAAIGDLRDIPLTFKDSEGNELKMIAGSLYSYLEPGNYNLAASVAKRFDAAFELTFGGKSVTLDEGKACVAKENNSYDIYFEFKSGENVYEFILSGKNIAFKTETYRTLSAGGSGTVKKDQYVSSSYLGKSIPYTIYLPKGYDETKEYPILYLLHGAFDNGQGHNNWYTKAAINAYASEYALKDGPEMIIVTPECCDDCFYCNGYKQGHDYMSFFFEEFVPHIESAYAVRSERNSRAVAGLSMGGYGSLYYGLLHPEMFCHVYACSAAIGITGAPDLYAFIKEAVEGSTLDELPGLTLEMGSSDSLAASNSSFVKFLKDNKVPHEYITRGGGHEWTFWNGCAPKIIAKVGAIFAHNE